MADLLDRTATGVRLQSKKRTPTVHKMVRATLKADVGRQYKTGCHRYLYADEGAILTTRKVDCAECNVIGRSS
jgi:Arc/MetJ family transcription regulator